ENNCILEEILRNLEANSPVDVKEPEGSDDYTEVTYDKEQCLSDHYTAPVTPPSYTPSIPFLATMKPADTLLMGDEVISTIPARESDEFIKSSVDDLVLIPRMSEEFEEISSLDPPPSPESTPVAAYSPKEVMYRYYHPRLTSGDGFDYELRKIPSGESKVRIKVLSVLWDAPGSCRLRRPPQELKFGYNNHIVIN
nr:hypothetical protein [Tanacetum cinerariifolium]